MRITSETVWPIIHTPDPSLKLHFVNENRDWLPVVRRDFLTLGWVLYHTRYSVRSEPGFPDLLLVHERTGRTIFAELKIETGVISPAQHGWLTVLSRANEVYVWRPSDHGEIHAIIEEEHQRATG